MDPALAAPIATVAGAVATAILMWASYNYPRGYHRGGARRNDDHEDDREPIQDEPPTIEIENDLPVMTAPKRPAAKKTAAKKTASQPAKKTATKKTAAKKAAPHKTAPKDTAHGSDG